MAKFLADSELNSQLEKLIDHAQRALILVSPYIKLHDRLRDKLRPKVNNPDLQLTVVFGKNEDDPNRSIFPEDLAFFQQFLHVEIRYERRLHAKYYANETHTLLTSMNLYDFSINNNIEFGILAQSPSGFERLASLRNLDEQAFSYFDQVIENSTLLFERVPVFEKKNFGLQKVYKHSQVKVDRLSEILGVQGSYSSKRQPVVYDHSPATGYCIRTGVEIPFNPARPMCYEAYQTWSQFENYDYPERYCHRTGRESYGRTSMHRPMLEG